MSRRHGRSAVADGRLGRSTITGNRMALDEPDGVEDVARLDEGVEA